MWRHPRRRASIVLSLALLVAGCSTPGPDGALLEETPPPETIGEGSVTLAGGDECHNPDAGYTVNYPSAWSANDGDVTTPCTVFDHRGRILLDRQTEVPLTYDVVVGTAPSGFDRYVEALRQGTAGIDVEALTDTKVADRDAVIVRGDGNGDALIPEGTRVHRYVVDLEDDRVLLASTYDTGDMAFARKIEVLDAMMDTLSFDDAQ